MIHYAIPEQSQFSYHIHDEKAMYPIWELQVGNQFVSSGGKIVTVISSDERNRFSGPDYKYACISISRETFIGDVELHIYNPD